MGRKAVVILAGIAAAAVAAAAAISWRAILEEIEFGRICRDPARLLAIAGGPGGGNFAINQDPRGGEPPKAWIDREGRVASRQALKDIGQ